MRKNRIVSGIIGFAMIGATPFVMSAAASAAPAPGDTRIAQDANAGDQASSQSPDARRKPARKITIRGVKRGRKLFVKGRVKGKPHYKRNPVMIFRKVGKRGKWRRFKVVQTNRRMKYRARITAPKRCGKRFYWIAKTPRTRKYRASYSRGNIYTYRVC